MTEMYVEEALRLLVGAEEAVTQIQRLRLVRALAKSLYRAPIAPACGCRRP